MDQVDIRSLAFRPSTSTILASGGGACTFRLVNLQDYSSRYSQYWEVVDGGNRRADSLIEVSNVQLDWQGRRMLFTTSDGRTMVYNTGTKEG
jgi:hypothetical protein